MDISEDNTYLFYLSFEGQLFSYNLDSKEVSHVLNVKCYKIDKIKTTHNNKTILLVSNFFNSSKIQINY